MSEAGVEHRARHPGKFFEELTGVVDGADWAVESLSVGGYRIDIRLAPNDLREIVMSALRHLPSEVDSPPSFTIDVFDSTATRTHLGPPPWGPEDYRARGEIRGFNDDGYRTAYRVDCGVLTMADLPGGRGVFWIRDRAFYPGWMEASPLRNLFSWWASWNGLQMVHAAAIGNGHNGLLLSGRGGSGKSTTALRAALGGLRFLGDDYVLVDPAAPRVHSIYSSAKLEPRALKRFAPHLADRSRRLVGEPANSKHLLLGTEVFPSALTQSLPLVAVVVPVIVDRADTRVSPISPADALTAVAPTTLFQLEGSSSEDLSKLADLVRALPCFRLDIGDDDSAVEVLGDLLARVP